MAGFDAAVAKAHGYKIVTLPNGDQQSVPIDPQSKLPKGPVHSQPAEATVLPSQQSSQQTTAAATSSTTDYSEVQGNCGVSWIRVTKTAAHKVSVASGFRNTPLPAYYWTWNVALSDKNGTSHQTYSGVTASTSASRIWSNLTQYSYTFDSVYSGGATLIDGTICLSGHPSVALTGL